MPFTRGNQIRRLKNGDQIFPAMLKAIRNARKSIEFETFVYWKGDIAMEFANAVSEAAGRGVEVRILLDAAGCKPMPGEIRSRLEESEAEVLDFGPLNPLKFWKLDNRTHRKILVCDGAVGFTGGVGIAEEWEGDARNPDEWRESHFELRGPAVRSLRAAFVQHWLSTLEDPGRIPASLPAPLASAGERSGGEIERKGPGGTEIQTLRSSAEGRWTDIQTLFRALLLSARKRIRITTAYFVPDDALLDLLCATSRRGVEVEIMHPGPHIDHRVSQLAGEAVYDRLLEAGVKIWRYQATMLHAKVVTLDGEISCIGSANFNMRSLGKDDEIAVVALDAEVTKTLDRDFEEDRTSCRLVDDPARWDGRTWHQKAGEAVARLFHWEV